MIGVFIYNAIAIISFAVLAFVFKKWWIILFSFLFIMTYKKNVKDDKNETKN